MHTISGNTHSHIGTNRIYLRSTNKKAITDSPSIFAEDKQYSGIMIIAVLMRVEITWSQYEFYEREYYWVEFLDALVTGG